MSCTGNITTRQVGLSAEEGGIVGVSADAGGIVGVSAETDVGGIVGVFSRLQRYKKSDTPPPPYEEPPPYHIALIMEQCQAYTISYPVLV